ncbi:tetraacyldisaccharide 4'-kinase [Flavobacterium sp. NKUCC04_CG]|uniref:tetraacyldisaccharide 4'-kinase n=1 Tax=Flavobacterium sp. NKUCC04_CG TaxID=2842121 RepID=UPI001C5B13D8|nr:tetraacyldisaccharide 4'-kinase [Flavobacterium sp. NKUCC04_CG]MBW3519791.1 tetraacyldisaccharide 4'-kinase [Flavobacterium sp. NKUCC04_CG]
MNLIRKVLFPFSILYGWITSIRNILYQRQIFKRHTFSIPLIVVGNLSVGGTGKTPMVEYLIRLLSEKYPMATLSRGYKRKTKGFVLADKHTKMEDIGDEPFQYFQKFPSISVAVDANRVHGIEELQLRKPQLELIVLDDAYQHLPVKANMNILLTTYSELYSDDWMLPTGNLREGRKGAQRAQVVVVTKCPKEISSSEQQAVAQRLQLQQHQALFFTYIEYAVEIFSKTEKLALSLIDRDQVVLVAGIAKPKSFFDYLKTSATQCLTYPDHHAFSDSDLELILKTAAGRKIITTEKDYMRLQEVLPSDQLYYLPIQTAFVNKAAAFDQILLNYVEQNSRNSSIS